MKPTIPPRQLHWRSLLNWTACLGLLLLLGLGSELLLHQYELRQQQVEQQQLLAHANEVSAVLLAELNATLHLASGLAAYIPAKHGQVDPEELKPWLEGLFQQGRHIRNIGLAPDNRIAFVYPLAGNEAALGLYYPDQTEQWPMVQRIIASRTPLLDGPLQLVQGGSGLIYRIPVFLEDQRYWGMISTVIDFDRLFAQAEEVARQRGIMISLRPFADQTRSSLTQGAMAPDAANTTLSVELAGAKWQLEARNLAASKPQLAGLRLLGWGLALICTALVSLALCAQHRKRRLLLALYQSQQQFLDAFDMLPHGLALLDPQGRLLATNHALCQLLQRSPATLAQQHLRQFCEEPDHPQLRDGLAATTPGHNRSWQQTLLNAQGEPVAAMLSAAVLSGGPGTEATRILHIQDIRESKHLQRLQSEFISTISHELRTPLTSIAGSLGLINGGVLGAVPASMQQMLTIAQDNSQHLSQLINDLLDMDKLVAGKMPIELSEQPLQPLLEQAIAQNQPYASQYRVQLQLLDPMPPARVRVDSQRLAQVLANLLSNAAKFSPVGQAVEIAVQHQGDQVRVSVHDHGPGVPEAFKARIFGKFSQADASDSRQKGGTGLGLAISKELIERMGGRIGFDSIAGQGTTFWLELPLAEGAQP